jgi:hypothetical membrane protein
MNSSAGRPRAGFETVVVLGIAAPTIYCFAVALGGLITPRYSHIANSISELTSPGVTARALLSTLFVAYDFVLLGFAVALARMPGIPRSLAAIAGSVTLALVAVAGLGMSTIFPAGPPAGSIPPTGWIHIALAAIASLGSMAAMASFAWSFSAEPRWRGFARFTAASLIIVLISGLWAATSAAQHSPIVGLAERTTIGAFMLWLLGFAVTFFRRAYRTVPAVDGFPASVGVDRR